MKNIEIKNAVSLTEKELQTTNSGVVPLVVHGAFILFQAGMAAGIYEQEKNIEKNKKGYVNQITYPFSYKIRGMCSDGPMLSIIKMPIKSQKPYV